MKNILVIQGGGGPNGNTALLTQIERMDWLEKAYAFGLNLYPTEEGIAWENVGGDR